MLAVLSMTATLIAAIIPNAPAGAAFYTPPNPLPAGTHGDVIWARPLTTAAALPSAASNTLVLYHTTGADGKDRAVSGMIALPKGTPPRAGWPVISGAHGTTGDAPACRVAAASDATALKIGVPVLLLQGSTDTTVPKASSDALDKALCASGTIVRYEVYQGLGHRPVVPASAPDALSWITARFAGTAAPSNCGAEPVLHG